MELTDAQQRALLALFDAGRQGLTAAEIGYALTPDRRHPLVPQGAGRLGGRVGTKLRELGLTSHGGWPMKYTVTGAGRILAKKLREEG